MRGPSLVAASGGRSSSRCAGLSLSRPLLLRSTGSRSAGSVIVAHGPSCSAACGILPDQGLNPCPLHWQADFQPLRHQGSPGFFLGGIIGHLYCSILFYFKIIPDWIASIAIRDFHWLILEYCLNIKESLGKSRGCTGWWFNSPRIPLRLYDSEVSKHGFKSWAWLLSSHVILCVWWTSLGYSYLIFEMGIMMSHTESCPRR